MSRNCQIQIQASFGPNFHIVEYEFCVQFHLQYMATDVVIDTTHSTLALEYRLPNMNIYIYIESLSLSLSLYHSYQ